MRLLMDTHAFLWFVWNDPQLTTVARQQIEDPQNDLFLSSASAWEIAIKIGVGKLSVGQELGSFLKEQMASNRMSLLPITIDHVAMASKLETHHKDPFDRMLMHKA